MISFVSGIIYLIFFIACITIELSRNKEWKKIMYPKTRFNSKGIEILYGISFIYMVFLTIINLIIGEEMELCVMTTLGSILMLLVANLSSRKKVIVTNKEVIKYGIISKTTIKLNEIGSIDDGYFLKIRSSKALIQIETKFYDSGLYQITNKLNELLIKK